MQKLASASTDWQLDLPTVTALPSQRPQTPANPDSTQLGDARNAYHDHLFTRYQFLDFKGMDMSDRLPLQLPLIKMYVPPQSATLSAR